MTIDIDLGDVWSHYCTLNEEGVVVDRRPRPLQDEFERSREVVYEYAPARVAMEAGTHSIWISEQLQELGHQVIVANVRELRAISHSDGKSDRADAEKLACVPSRTATRLSPCLGRMGYSRPAGRRTVDTSSG
jgi:transposase